MRLLFGYEIIIRFKSLFEIRTTKKNYRKTFEICACLAIVEIINTLRET